MLTLAALVSGCATNASLPSTPELEVQQRAKQYWQARIAKKPEQAYALTAPSYRKLRTAEQFAMQVGNAATVRDASVHRVNCEPERCVVRMALQVRAVVAQVDAGLVTLAVDETWVLEDGQWWFHQSI